MGDRLGVMRRGGWRRSARRRRSTSTRRTVSWPNSSAPPTCCAAIVRRSEADGSLLEVPGLGLVRASRPAPRGVGESIFLAIRPERIALGSAAPPNAFCAPIAETAYRGDALSCTLRLPDGTALRVTRPLSGGAPTALPAAGEVASVSFAPDACILLTE